MSNTSSLFVLGKDYHLGDLLWLTAVLAEYRRQVQPRFLMVACPDRPISRILEKNPMIDQLLYGRAPEILLTQRRRYGHQLIVHDLHILPLARSMMQAWRTRVPWRYYRDLWCEPRGQWLATFLGLGPMRNPRPILCLDADDRRVARLMPLRYVVLAPHIGQYSLPMATAFWRRVKGWSEASWIQLSHLLQQRGYTPVTLGALGQEPVPGSIPLLGLPIRQVAGVIERAAGLVTVESGLWFIAAALATPYVIVPWWLPCPIDWPGAIDTPHRIVRRAEAEVERVMGCLCDLMVLGGDPAAELSRA